MLNWYRIERILGQGGFGVIYLATDTNLDHLVAIKEYIPSDIATRASNSHVHPITEEHDDMYRWGLDRFLKEARNLVKFKHPNIVRVMSVFQENNTAYMVMEYEEGEELRSYVKKSGMASEETLKSLIVPISQGLTEVHRHGFIHRDIKPNNILVRRDGTPVLLDFGSARNASRATQHALTALVSVGYAPIEQYNGDSGEQQGPWTDIYALGGVLYFAISGSDPMDCTRRGSAIINGGKDPLISAIYLGEGKYSEPFLQAVDWAMQFRIADRPQTVGDWLPALLSESVVVPSGEVSAHTLLRADLSPWRQSGPATGQPATGQPATSPPGTTPPSTTPPAQTQDPARRATDAVPGDRRRTSDHQPAFDAGTSAPRQEQPHARQTGQPTGQAVPPATGAAQTANDLTWQSEDRVRVSPDVTASRRRPVLLWTAAGALVVALAGAGGVWLASRDNTGASGTLASGTGQSEVQRAAEATRQAELESQRAAESLQKAEADRKAREEEERAAQQRAADQKAAEEKAAAEKLAQQQAAEQKAAEERAAELRAAEERAAAKAAAERAAAQKLADEQAAREKAAEEQAAREKAAEEQAAREQAAREKAERDEAARIKAAQEQAARDKAAREQAAREKAAQEQAAREKAAQEQAAREQAAREQAEREEAAKAQAARDEAARQQAAREKAARDKAARDAETAARTRLNEALLESEKALSSGDVSTADRQLESAKSLGIEDRRIAQLDTAIARYKEDQLKPVSDEDFEKVMRMFDGLKRAIESKDTRAMDRIAISSEQNKLFKQLMDSFSRINVEIRDINVRNADKSIVARLRIRNMVRANGDQATPAESYRDRQIKSRRINGGWSRINW